MFRKKRMITECLQQYDFHPSVHLAVVVGGIGDDGVAFATTLDLDTVGVDAATDHGTADLLATTLGENLVGTVGTDIVRMTDDADALIGTHPEEIIEFGECRFGRVENARLARRKIDIMQDEGLDFLRRHDDAVELAVDENRIVEGKIIDGSGIDGVVRHAVVEQQSDERMDAVGSGLHHLLALMIAHNDVRCNRTSGERVGDSEGDTCLGIKRNAETVLVFAMVEIECIGSKIADLGRLDPVLACRQRLGDAGMLGVGGFVEFGLLVGPRIDVLHNNVGGRQLLAGLQVIRIDVEEQFAVLDALSLGGFGLGDAFLLRRRFLGGFFLCRLAFGRFAFALRRCERLGRLRIVLAVRRSGIKRLSEEGEEHYYYEEQARAHT